MPPGKGCDRRGERSPATGGGHLARQTGGDASWARLPEFGPTVPAVPRRRIRHLASARKGGPAGQAMVDEALHLDVRVVGQEPLQGRPEAWLCGNRGDLGKPVQKPLASNGCPARKPVRMRYAGACAEIRRGARTPVCAAAEGVPLGERSRPPMAPRYEIRLVNVGPPPGHLRLKAATDETDADKSAPAAGQGHGPSAVRRVHRTGAVPSLPVPSASPLPWPCRAGPRRGYSGGPSHPLPTRP